ncbi:hypothetical protein VP01_5509g1 [Puccinia sorghi]|uniref:Uncharacterized protein n=1 Tax=Puccinia sorghi TaxID=27349 RepID=A0A0L6UJC6_9BASI|nr:hypothetical protein VP01_5509g1 [Puccinia sorghi]
MAVHHGDKMLAVGRGASPLSFKKTQRQKLNRVALVDVKTGLGGECQWEWFVLQGGKKRIGLQRIFDFPLEYHELHCQVTTKFLLFGRVVLVFLLMLNGGFCMIVFKIKNEYQVQKMMTISDMSYDHFKTIHKGGSKRDPPTLDLQPTGRCGTGPGGLRNQFLVHKWGSQNNFCTSLYRVRNSTVKFISPKKKTSICFSECIFFLLQSNEFCVGKKVKLTKLHCFAIRKNIFRKPGVLPKILKSYSDQICCNLTPKKINETKFHILGIIPATPICVLKIDSVTHLDQRRNILWVADPKWVGSVSNPQHKSLSMNHLIFLMILHSLLEFKYNQVPLRNLD